MSTPVKKSGLNLTKNNKILLAVVALLLCGLIAVGASTVLSNPADENVKNTVTDPPAATPTPAGSITPTEVHLSSNNTETPWIRTDFLELTAQLNTPAAGVTITLLNKGEVVTTAVTDETGTAIFVRNPQKSFDYSVTATIP